MIDNIYSEINLWLQHLVTPGSVMLDNLWITEDPIESLKPKTSIMIKKSTSTDNHDVVIVEPEIV